MSRKICFSAMLQEKKEQQKRAQMSIKTLPSLRDFIEEFIRFPDEDFVLRCGQQSNMSQCSSKGGEFEMGINPLQAWFSNQAQNKENMMDGPQRRPPIALQKSNPNKKESFESDFAHNKGTKKMAINNIPMKDLCKKFVEDKSNQNQKKQELVWKFGSKANSSVEEEMVQSRASSRHQNRPQVPIRQQFQNKLSERKEESGYESSQNQGKELVKKPEQGQLSKLVGEIKNSLTKEIEVMAERIILDKQQQQYEEEEDQEILVSKKSSQKESSKGLAEKERIERAQRQISEYLQAKEPHIRKQQEDYPQREGVSKISSQGPNSPVGYSFASDFNSQIKNEQSKANEDISLPNIDEVHSERDELEKHDMHSQFVEEAKKVQSRESRQSEVEIDKNCIQEIQSVAYEPPKIQSQVHIKQSIQEMKDEQSVNASLPNSQQEKASMKASKQESQQKGETEEQANSVKNMGSMYISGPNRFDFKKVCSPSKGQSITSKARNEIQTSNADYKIGKEDSIKQPSSIQRYETNYMNENTKNSLLKMSKKSSGSSKGYKISPPADQPKKMLKITLSPNFNPQAERDETTVNTFNASNGRKMGSRQESMRSIGENGGIRSSQFQFELDF